MQAHRAQLGLLAALVSAALVSTAAVAVPAAGQAPQEPGGPHVLWRSTIGAPVPHAGLCEGAEAGLRSEAMPLIGVDPADDRLVRASWSAHGEKLQLAGTSTDGGRTWTAAPVAAATACSGGPQSRSMSVNTLFDVGAGGAAYVGTSWFNSPGEPVFEFGIDVHKVGSGQAAGVPQGSGVQSQNAAVLADPADPQHVAVAWAWMQQVPNPMTYTPLPNQVRFAESFDGGQTWSDHVVVHEAPAGELAVNPRLVRAADGGLVVLVDRARLADVPGGQAGLSAPEFIFHAVRSGDGGRTWSDPVLLGSGELYEARRPDADPARPEPRFAAVKPDLAAGPDNEVVAVWHDATRTTVRMARSADGGRTWSAATDTVGLPGLPYQVAVAVDGRGTTGLFWYDFREDVPGDASWTLRPWAAVQGRDGVWRQSPVDEPFDLSAAATCTETVPRFPSCDPGSHAGPLGVYQDLEGLPHGFAVAYTVAGALAQDGFTDARVARLTPGGRAG